MTTRSLPGGALARRCKSQLGPNDHPGVLAGISTVDLHDRVRGLLRGLWCLRAARTVAYRWRADEPAFAMPVRVGAPCNWQIIRPTATWQVMPLALDPDQFQVATDLYYVEVAILDAAGRPVK